MKNKNFPTYTGLAIALIFLITATAFSPSAKAQQPNRVALIVDFGDSHITRCIEFSESKITGYDVLRRSGLEIVADTSDPMGVAICDINNTSGCPASNCFCKCQGSPCRYWAYHHLVNGSWQYSQLGASNYQVKDGDVEGWAWGEGSMGGEGSKPPLIPFDQICAPPATDTPTPTNTPIPPTSTPIPPTNTPIPPTNTPTPEDEATSAPAPEAWFRLDQNPVEAGACTVLRWNTSHAQDVYLDGEEVDFNGDRQVCPMEAREYKLRVVGTEEEEHYKVTLGVTGSASTATPEAASQPTTVPASTTSATPTERAEAAPPSPTPESESSSQVQAVASPSPTPNVSENATTPQAPTTSAGATSSLTPMQAVQSTPTSTPAQVAQADTEAQQPSSTSEDEKSEGNNKRSLLLPLGYVAFSLIVGGLLGWLIYILKFQK